MVAAHVLCILLVVMLVAAKNEVADSDAEKWDEDLEEEAEDLEGASEQTEPATTQSEATSQREEADTKGAQQSAPSEQAALDDVINSTDSQLHSSGDGDAGPWPGGPLDASAAERVVQAALSRAQANAQIREHLLPALQRQRAPGGEQEEAAAAAADVRNASRDLLGRVSRVLADMLEGELRGRQCLALPPSQRQFLQTLMQFAPSKEEPPAADSDVTRKIEHLRKLIGEYEDLSDDEKGRARPVHAYLAQQLQSLYHFIGSDPSGVMSLQDPASPVELPQPGPAQPEPPQPEPAQPEPPQPEPPQQELPQQEPPPPQQTPPQPPQQEPPLMEPSDAYSTDSTLLDQQLESLGLPAANWSLFVPLGPLDRLLTTLERNKRLPTRPELLRARLKRQMGASQAGRLYRELALRAQAARQRIAANGGL